MMVILAQTAAATVPALIDIPNLYNILNLIASGGLIFAAGKIVNRLEVAEARIKKLEDGDTNRAQQTISIAVLNTKMDSLQVGMDELKNNFGDFRDSVRWKRDGSGEIGRGGA